MNYIQPQNREQMEMMSMESLISSENEVRVVDAFVDALDMKSLGFEFSLKEEGHPPFHPEALQDPALQKLSGIKSMHKKYKR